MTNRVLLTCLLPLLLMGLSCGDSPDVYSITIPALKIEPDWTIVGMDLSINAGSVQAVQNIPLGWAFTIVDNATWQSKIKGVCNVQAGSLSPDELKKVVFIVRKKRGGAFQFDVSGAVTMNKAFENAKQVDLTVKDFSLAAAPQ